MHSVNVCHSQKKTEKLIKTPYFGVLGSFKLIDAGATGKPVSSAFYDKPQVSVCLDPSHAGQANSGQITILWGVPVFNAVV